MRGASIQGQGASKKAECFLRLPLAPEYLPLLFPRYNPVMAIDGSIEAATQRLGRRLLADLRTVGESATELDTWLTIHTYLVAMLRKFRGAVDPLRSLAREIMRPFEAGGESPFLQWYRDTSANIPVVRCLFEDNELHRAFVSSLILGSADSHRLGDKYREDSILIEPDTGHFELEKPDVVSKHIEAMLATIEVPAAAT